MPNNWQEPSIMMKDAIIYANCKVWHEQKSDKEDWTLKPFLDLSQVTFDSASLNAHTNWFP